MGQHTAISSKKIMEITATAIPVQLQNSLLATAAALFLEPENMGVSHRGVDAFQMRIPWKLGH